MTTTETSPQTPGVSRPDSEPGRFARITRLVGGSRHSLKDWLDRPMTSWHLIMAIFSLLLGFGLLMVLSASSITEIVAGSSPFAVFENQAVFAVIGLVGFFFASRFAIGGLRRLAFPAVITAVGLLAAVLAVGHKYNGARSWLGFGSFSFQPSEVAKLALLLWMAHVLSARRHQLRSLKALLFPVLPMFGLMVALIMLEPDLGTTVSLGIVFLAVLWFAGAPLWIFGALLVGAVGGGVALAISAPYRFARVTAYLHPNSAPAAAVYQVQQGLYGLGHGGIFGAGLGQSLAKWGRLPNADSDFIFAIIGEELGLIGALMILLLFGLLAYTGLRIARRNVDPFIKVMASACTVWLVGQAAINIGYVVGLLPVTGIPLPMISAGGTSLVVTMVVFGLLANFARREPQAMAALHSRGPGRFAKFLGVDVRSPKPPKPRKVKPRRDSKPDAGNPDRRPTRSTDDRAVAAQDGRRSASDGRRAESDGRRSGRSDANIGRPEAKRSRSQAKKDRSEANVGRSDMRKSPSDAKRNRSDTATSRSEAKGSRPPAPVLRSGTAWHSEADEGRSGGASVWPASGTAQQRPDRARIVSPAGSAQPRSARPSAGTKSAPQPGRRRDSTT